MHRLARSWTPALPVPPIAIAAVSILAAAGTPSADTTIDYRDFMRWTGRSLALPDSGRAIEYRGSLAFVAANGAGLTIVDITDVDDPEILTTVNLPGGNAATDVALAGDYAYLTLGFGGLVAVDVSNPGAPVVVSQQPLDGVARAVHATPNKLLVALTRLAPDGRLIAFDLTALPAIPQEIGRVPTPRQAFEVTSRERTAYVPDVLCQEIVGCVGGLGIYRIVDGNPIEIGYRGTGPFDNICVSGPYAHIVSSSNFGYRIYDVTSPKALQIVSSISSLRPKDVAVDAARGLAFLTGDGLDIVDIADVTDPRLLGSVHSPPAFTARRVQLLGKRAYLSDGLSLTVIDVAKERPAPLAGGIDTPSIAEDVASTGATGVVADVTSLRAYDLSAPGKPAFEGAIAGGYTAVAARDGYAYALAPGTFSVVDLSGPGAPLVAGSAPSPGTPTSIALTAGGDYALATYFRGGATDGVVRVFDVTDPAAPALVRGLDTGTTNEALDIHVDGTSAYVSLVQLLEYDITDPEAPSIRRVYQAPGSIRAFTSDGVHGFAVSTAGDRSWVTSYALGTTAPIASLEVPGSLTGVTLLDGIAYVASGGCGVGVVDVRDPARPVYLGGADTPGSARQVALLGSTAVLVADRDGGLRIAARQAPSAVAVDPADVPGAATRLGPIVPNPLRGAGRVTIVLASSAVLDLDVFDAAGRRVRTLLDGVHLDDGTHTIAWDGTDDAGRSLGAGTYFVRIAGDGAVESRRVVVIR